MNLAGWIQETAKSLVSVFAAVSLLGSLSFWVLQEKLEPWLTLPQDVALISETLKSNGITNKPDFIHFEPVHFVPGEFNPGEIITIPYYLERHKNCSTTVVMRWWSLETGSYSPYTEVRPAIETEIVMAPRIFPFRVRIPLEVTGGTWAYHPTLTCDGEQISPPPAFFNVRDGAANREIEITNG